MIVARLRIAVPEHRKAETLRAMRSIQGPASAKPGCIDCRILEDVNDATLIFYIEEWGSVEQLERHIRSDYYRRLLAIMETSDEAPDVRYDTISRRQGIELVEMIRSKPAESGLR